jgi:hypothetical protein
VRILIDAHASDQVERFHQWHASVPRLVRALSERGHDVVICADGRTSDGVVEAIRATPRAEMVDFPRRFDRFPTWAMEADLLTRISLSHNVNAVLTTGHSYVVGLPTLVVLAADTHGAIDSATLDTNLLLRLAVSMASRIVVPNRDAQTAVQALLPSLASEGVHISDGASIDSIIPPLLETMDTRLEWFHDSNVSEFIRDYQRRAHLLQT